MNYVGGHTDSIHMILVAVVKLNWGVGTGVVHCHQTQWHKLEDTQSHYHGIYSKY